MAEWKDCTSYSRGDTERVPRAWELRLADLRVVVVSNHIYYPGEWVMHFAPFFTAHSLNVKTAEEARRKALKIARRKIEECWNAIREASK